MRSVPHALVLPRRCPSRAAAVGAMRGADAWRASRVAAGGRLSAARVAGHGAAAARCRRGPTCRRRATRATARGGHGSRRASRRRAARATHRPRVRPRVPDGPAAGRCRSTCRRAGAARGPRRSRRSIVDDRSGRVLERGRDPGGVDHGARASRGVRARGQRPVGLDPAVRALPRAVRCGRRCGCCTSTWPCCSPSRSPTRSSAPANLESRCRPPTRCSPTCSCACCGWRSPPRDRPAAAARRAAERSCCSALVFLVGFRVGLERHQRERDRRRLLGRHRRRPAAHGERALRRFPPDNARGDTYGPVAYAPTCRSCSLLPGAATWDDLPAAHGAAVAFDLACVGGLLLAGRRLGGPRLGAAAGLPVGGVSVHAAGRQRGRQRRARRGARRSPRCSRSTGPPPAGRSRSLAGLTKFAPLALVPLFVDLRPRGRAPQRCAAAGVAAAALVLGPWRSAPGGLERFWDRTLGFQAERASPFSIWGLYGGLDALQAALTVAAARARRGGRLRPAPA